MPRKGPAPRRELEPDPVYRSVLVSQVVKAARDLGKDDIVRAIQSELRDIEQAEEVLRSVLGKLDTPSAVGESDEEPGVPAMDGEGPHGAGMGPRAMGRKARQKKCKRAKKGPPS